MKRRMKKIVCTALICCLIFSSMQGALAAHVLVTTEGVNYRTGPSTDAEIISSINPNTRVDVIEHDPAGWSKVRFDGTTGYIRSDFLAAPSGGGSTTFRTTDGVNFRSGPSMDAGILSTINPNTNVDVLEHNPAGWSRVRHNGATGFIRSDFLALPIGAAQQSSSSPSQSTTTLRTVSRVNFRTGPSMDASVIRTLDSGLSVEVLERDPHGWTRVRINGTVGYIRSDLLNVSGVRNVELLEWSVASSVVRIGVPIRVVDVRTGLSYNIQAFSKSGHADVDPLTRADTETMRQTRNGTWSWAARPVWVTIGDRTLAAAINGMPHAGSTIRDNGVDGHFCLHFAGTVTNNKSYQADLRNAVAEAYNAATGNTR